MDPAAGTSGVDLRDDAGDVKGDVPGSFGGIQAPAQFQNVRMRLGGP